MNATSRWCALLLESGKLQSSKFLDNQDYSTYNTDRALIVDKWKIPTFDATEDALRFSITIANSEYDHYMHVNNTRYADYCFNAFSVQELRSWRLKTFAISYVRQCHEGDVLRFYRKEIDGAFCVQGVNDTGEIVVQAQIKFDRNSVCESEK
jgi:acyl-ACP thioesterase